MGKQSGKFSHLEIKAVLQTFLEVLQIFRVNFYHSEFNDIVTLYFVEHHLDQLEAYTVEEKKALIWSIRPNEGALLTRVTLSIAQQ